MSLSSCSLEHFLVPLRLNRDFLWDKLKVKRASGTYLDSDTAHKQHKREKSRNFPNSGTTQRTVFSTLPLHKPQATNSSKLQGNVSNRLFPALRDQKTDKVHDEGGWQHNETDRSDNWWQMEMVNFNCMTWWNSLLLHTLQQQSHLCVESNNRNRNRPHKINSIKVVIIGTQL